MRRRNVSAHVKRLVAARALWRCELCDALLQATFECDHVVQHAQGGSDDPSNLRALCRACHGEVTLRQEIERLERRRRAAEAGATPPLCCLRCNRVVSPYFVHRCTSGPT